MKNLDEKPFFWHIFGKMGKIDAQSEGLRLQDGEGAFRGRGAQSEGLRLQDGEGASGRDAQSEGLRLQDEQGAFRGWGIQGRIGRGFHSSCKHGSSNRAIAIPEPPFQRLATALALDVKRCPAALDGY